jgi:hypothetical protein
MGTWSSDPFGNDAACDWKYDVEQSTGLQLIEESLDAVLSSEDESLDSTDAELGIAAAETIARLRGYFYLRDAYTESLDKWVERQTCEVPQDLVDSAIRVVDRVLTEPSDLLELWTESGDPEEWIAQMEALKERLRQPPVK